MKFFEKQHFTLFSNFYFYILQSVQMQIKKKISSHMPGNDETDIQIIVSNQYYMPYRLGYIYRISSNI